MAKRSRGSSRPGQRKPAQKAPARGGGPRPGGLTAAEEARAAELEAQLVAEEPAAAEARARSSARANRPNELVRPVGRPNTGLLAQKAAEEYTYVVRDVAKIVRVGGGLFVLLAVVYLLRSVLHVF
jgi:hypothetical protein